MLQGEKILITGVDGRVAFPIARALAADNEVWGVARLRDPASRTTRGVGVRPVPLDVSAADFSSLPDDFTYVFHAAIDLGTDGWASAFETNCPGLGPPPVPLPRLPKASCSARPGPSTSTRDSAR